MPDYLCGPDSETEDNVVGPKKRVKQRNNEGGKDRCKVMEIALLTDVCDIQYGYPFDSSKFNNSQQGMPLIRIRDVMRGFSETYTSEEYEEEYIITEGELLIGMDGEFNISRWGKDAALLNQRVCHLIPRKIDKSYLFYFMPSALKKIEQKTPFVTVKHLSAKELSKIEVPIPPLKEQIKMAAVLDKVSLLIVKQKEQLNDLDILVKSRFIELFGSEREFGRWPCCNIGDVAEVCVGVVIKPTQYYTEKGIPAFRSLNIGMMKVKDNDWVYFTEEGHKKNQKSVVRANDVLIVRSGAPGTACVATEKYDGYNAVDIIIAHPDQGKVNSVFLAAFTNMPHGMNQIKGGTGGAAQQHFNVGRYKAMTLIMPPLELQQQFAAFVAQVDKSKHFSELEVAA